MWCCRRARFTLPRCTLLTFPGEQATAQVQGINFCISSRAKANVELIATYPHRNLPALVWLTRVMKIPGELRDGNSPGSCSSSRRTSGVIFNFLFPPSSSSSFSQLASVVFLSPPRASILVLANRMQNKRLKG